MPRIGGSLTNRARKNFATGPTDVLTRLVNNWPNRHLGELLPWM